MKKIAISLSIVLFAIFFFFYLQLQQAKTLVVEQLAKRDIELEAVSLNFFPHLSISLEQVKYHAVSVKKLKENYPFFHLFLAIRCLMKFKFSKLVLPQMR